MRIEGGGVNSDRAQVLKFAGAMFVIALVGYGVLYPLDQRARERKGPWVVRFATNEVGEPMMEVAQEHLGATRRIVFGGERVPVGFAPVVKRFDRPEAQGTRVPFGKWIYHDLMYLPGVVTFDLFVAEANGTRRRHEVELAPRGLWVNRREFSWRGREEVRLERGEKRDWQVQPRK